MSLTSEPPIEGPPTKATTTPLGATSQRPVGSRRRRWAAVGLAAAIVVAVATFVVTLDDNDDVELPALPSDLGPTQSFLTDQGRALVEFHRASAPLASLGDEPQVASDTCKTVAAVLDTTVPRPSELLGTIEQVPDRGLGGLALNDLVAKSDLLRTCDPTQGEFRQRAEEVSATHTIVARRLDAYGIR